MKNTNLTNRFIALTKRMMKNLSAPVEHVNVIASVRAETELTPGYFAALTCANLIALLGLLTNSSPVIIGAMLISPLMGPILSAGAMFSIGDIALQKKSLKKILISVAITVAVAAAASFISPLKDITAEIAARTRPNLYDLLVAFLAGGVGASAICTKKNYLTIVPGVAIATAVIPPLSVCGFGLGVLNLPIFIGGFFLFFTNFVAIMIVTALVFLLYGFRPGIGSEADMVAIKRHALAMAFVLFLISIPLIYTLYSSVSKARLRVELNKALGVEFNREGRLHMAGFTFADGKDDTLVVKLSLNTRSYLMEDEIFEVQERLGKSLGRDVLINAEQVLVQAGGLKTEPTSGASALTPAGKSARTPSVVLQGARDELMHSLRPSRDKLSRIMAPYKVASLGVNFTDLAPGAHITLQVKRDEPFATAMHRTLERVLSEELGHAVVLKLEYVPIVDSLAFKPGEVEIPQSMKTALTASLQDVIKGDQSVSLSIEPFTGLGEPQGKARKDAAARAKALQQLLAAEFKLAQGSIEVAPVRKGKGNSPVVTIKALSRD